MKVDLAVAPALRWNLPPERMSEARELLESYQRDLGLPASLMAHSARPLIRPDYWAEMEGLAARASVATDEVVAGNLYYDALKTVLMGCTAFAVDTPDGPLHARNLDWWTDNGMLRRYTMVTRFTGASAGEFTTVGWPGFVGTFSGIAPGRFAVTLNAIISDEPLQPACPIVFLLRQILEEAPGFASALETLRTVNVASDSLLLLTGVRAGEMAVIERTPRRAEVRFAENGSIFVTNNYRALRTGVRDSGSSLEATACGRYERIAALVESKPPSEAESCFACLDDESVRMGITVQQMVFQAATGMCRVR